MPSLPCPICGDYRFPCECERAYEDKREELGDLDEPPIDNELVSDNGVWNAG